MSANEGDQLRTRATGFRITANDLQRRVEQMSGTPGGLGSQAARAGGYMTSVVVLRAFAAECYLKALSVRRTGHYRKDRKGHDLLVLFDDLDQNAKEFLESLARHHGVVPPRGILENHRNDFTEWRYPQDAVVSANMVDLDKLLEVLAVAYTHKDF